MATPAAVARACIESNERLLRATRHRLGVSRRLLYHPGLTIAGGSDKADAPSSVRRTLRILLASGALRPLRGRVTWAGYGSGHACCVCGQPVGRSEVEYEVDDGRPKMMECHFACFVLWHEESLAFTEDDRHAG
jgi:hypothetical protein